MKKFLTFIAICLMIIFPVESAELNENINIAVMDLGIYQGTSEPDLNLINAEKTAGEYIIQRLVMTNKFNVADKNMVRDKLKGFKLDGIIEPNTAKEIGKILNVKYIVYGNVTGISANEDIESVVNVNIVKAGIVTRIMDIETGKIIMAAKGEGKSRSAFAHFEGKTPITIGTCQVSQDSVHNAIQKAAFQSVDILVKRLFDKESLLK